MASGKTTIYDVAARADVSASTVSRALSNDPRVSAGTVAKVRSAMRAVGYVPRPVRHRQSSRKEPGPRPTYWYVSVLTTDRSWVLQEPVYSRVLQGLELGLREARFDLVLRHLPSESPATYVPDKIDGAILFNAPEDDGLTRLVRKLACVRVMGLVEDDGLFDHVTYRNRSIGRLAAEYLLEAGCGALACIRPGPPDTTTGMFGERSGVFADTAATAGREAALFASPDLLFRQQTGQSVRVETLRGMVRELPRNGSGPLGIFVVADELAVPLYGLLREDGLEPGRDVIVVGCNNDRPFLNALHPCPATVDIQSERVGRRAAEQVVWRIANPKEPRVVITLEPELVRGT